MKVTALVSEKRWGILLFIIASIYTILMLAYDPRLPGNEYPEGILGWSDQGHYVKIARDLIDGALEKPHYPFGYPITLIPFLDRMSNPFAPVSFLLLLLTTVFIYRGLCQTGSSTQVSFILTLCALFTGIYSDYFLVAFSNSVSILAMAIVVYFLLQSREAPSGKGHIAIASGLAGWVFATRYLDALPICIATLVLVLRGQGSLVRRLAAAAIPFLVFLVMVLLYQKAYCGGALNTPYAGHVRFLNGILVEDSSWGAWFPWKIPQTFFELYITPYSFSSFREIGDFPGLAQRFPLIILGFVSLPLVYRRMARNRLEGIALVSVFLLINVLYLSFWATGGSNMKFYCQRYLTLFVPVYLVGIALFINGLAGKGDKVFLRRSMLVTSCLLAPMFFYPVTFRLIELITNRNDDLRSVRYREHPENLTTLFDRDYGKIWQSRENIAKGAAITLTFKKETDVRRITFFNPHSQQDHPEVLSFRFQKQKGAWLEISKNDIAMSWATGTFRYSFKTTLRDVRSIQIVSRSEQPAWWSIAEIGVY